MNTPTGSQANTRVFLSRPLTKDVRLSGTAGVDLVGIWGAACGDADGRHRARHAHLPALPGRRA